MKIKYEFADGEVSVVDVEDELGAVITDSRRKEDNLERKERYHCYSLDGAVYEGNDFADTETPETVHIQQHRDEKIKEALNMLPEVQRRRISLLIDGVSIQEIARREGVRYYSVWKSIEAARKKLKNFFNMGD